MEFYGSIHNHTDASNHHLRDSINNLSKMCWYAARDLKHNFIAITDHETIMRAIECQDVEAEIRKEFPDFKIVRGNEIYLCRDGLDADNFVRGEDRFWHFILLAKDEIGHQQIRELSTRAWSRSFQMTRQTRIPTYYSDLREIIGNNPGHVIFSSACLGSRLANRVLNWYNNGRTLEGWEYLKNWVKGISEICGKENFFLETQPSFNKEQIIVNQTYKALSEELSVPVVVSLDAHYMRKEEEPIHHAFLTSQDGERETKEFYATTYLMSREEIHSYMDESLGSETVSLWLNNTEIIYKMCEYYDLTKPTRIVYIPKTIDKIDEEEFLEYKDKIKELEYFYTSKHAENRDLAAAIVKKIKIDPIQYNNKRTFEEIDDNLKAIRLASEKMNTQWSAYLLNLRDYVDIIWNEGNSLMGPARGSGTGFLLLNMLNVTQINPLRETTKTYSFRFLNPERVSPLDVDLDIEGGKRDQVYKALQNAYGSDRVSKVLTIRTEKSKSALITAARGLGLTPEQGSYLSSFIKADRGQARTLAQTYYGDIENDIPPDKKFRELMDGEYKEVWEVAKFIEGLCCGIGSHAGGVIFYDEPITNTTALMCTTNGDLITQYDLHTAERVSLLKIDLLSIEALDRMRATLDLLTDYAYLDKNKSLRERYEEAIGIYNIDRDNAHMWKMIEEHKIESLFQMEQQSGIKGIAAVKPTSIDDLAALNAVIRLMAPEKGAEQPVDKFARFKSDIRYWYDEMRKWGVKEEYWPMLEEVVGISYGMCIQQEQFMILVQKPELGGFSLLWADKLRKSIAKKNPAAYDELTKEFYEVTKEKGCDEKLCKYVWDNLIALNKGYGFNAAHTLAYSLVALQEMNLAEKFPLIFWSTANLIVDSGSMNLKDKILEEVDDVEENEDEEEEEEKATSKKKIKNSSSDYGKLASAIGKMKANKLNFASPDINLSDITFTPDIENNLIRYGLKGITRIGNQLIKDIISNRPYTSVDDFLSKVSVNVLQMVSLIKAGTFDQISDLTREEVMFNYLRKISKPKNRITLQNMNGLIEMGLIPEEYDFYRRLYNFNKYIKKLKNGNFYYLDTKAMGFFMNNYDETVLDNIKINGEESSAELKCDIWDRTYKKGMDPIRVWMKEKQQEILDTVNNKLFEEVKNKYGLGSLAKWEMDSLNFYSKEHELENLKECCYDIIDYNSLPDEPPIEKVFKSKDGKEIPIYQISRIAGTVIDKNKDKGLLTLLTRTGVVTVKIWKTQFAEWDKRIIEILPNGKKRVVEKSWFERGNKIIITGIKKDKSFIPKIYKNTEYPLFEKIEELDDKGFIISSKTERAEV